MISELGFFPIMKTCNTCLSQRNESEFREGRRKCKFCRNKEWNDSFTRRYRTDEAFSCSMIFKSRKWKENNREKARILSQKQNEKYKSLGKKSPRDPFKIRANTALNNALKSGKITKPSSCQQCGWEGRIHGHHHNYSKPFDVEWLCSICHGKKHRKPISED